MKNITRYLSATAFAVFLATGSFAYCQDASSAPEHNKTDGSMNRDGSAGDASTKTGSTTSTGSNTSTGSGNDTSHLHTGTADQTKAANNNKNGPGA